jgi:thymidine phosphorylase
LVLDVKFGSGAFMKTREEAEELAESLRATAEANGVRTSFLLSAMDQPLGQTVGNALEVAEAVEGLRGGGSEDLVALTLDLAAKVSQSSREELAGMLGSGAAWEKFVEVVEAQGGDVAALTRMATVHAAPEIRDVLAETAGTIRRVDAGGIGRASVRLGAGRATAVDAVDHAVGFSEIAKVGDAVGVGDLLMRVHARDADGADAAVGAVREAVVVG